MVYSSKYKLNKYILKLKHLKGGSFNLDEIAYWEKIKFYYLLSFGYNPPKCKIMSSFDGGDHTADENFMKLNESEKMDVMKLFFENKYIDYKYHYCDCDCKISKKKHVLFYNYKLLHIFLESLHLLFDYNIGKETLLNFSCTWNLQRPVIEEYMIQLLFGTHKYCNKSFMDYSISEWTTLVFDGKYAEINENKNDYKYFNNFKILEKDIPNLNKITLAYKNYVNMLDKII